MKASSIKNHLLFWLILYNIMSTYVCMYMPCSLVIITTWKTRHNCIYWYSVYNTKNLFKHSKNKLEGELHDLKTFLNDEIFISLPATLPDHRKWPTTQTVCPIASILSQSKSYFHPHEPFLYWKWFLLCAIVITFIYNAWLSSS